jgi:glycogen synthase
MNIALVTTEFVTEPSFDGGLANYLLRLTLALKQYGHVPVVFVTSDRQEVITYRGIEVHRIKVSFEELPLGSILSFVNKFYRTYLYLNRSLKVNSYLRKIHNHNPFDIVQYTHLVGLGLLRHKKIPSIVRLSSYTQACLKANEITGYTQQQIWEECAMRRMDGIFGPSQLVCSIIEEKLNRPVKIIESPFVFDVESNDDSVFERHLKGKEYLLFFGTISFLKGIDTIAKVLKPIFQNYPDLYFVFVGKDNGTPNGQPLVPRLFEMAGEYKDRVIYLGKLRHEELYPVISHSSVVVLPSRIENLSNACIEAMAHKRIVIGTRGTSFEQLIVDGENGFLCEVDDEENLFSTINKVMDLDFNERERIGLNALERIQSLHPNIVVNQLIDFYAEVIVMKNQRKFWRQQ